jgi:hypothetical protein
MTSRRIVSLALGALMALALIPATTFAKDVSRVRVNLVNTGAAPSASGHAEYRVRKKNRVSFHVEAEDLAPANYDVTVDGVLEGVLDVRQLVNNKVEGEIEFDTKVEPGHVLLDFDPRGKLVTVERAGVVYLQVVFPVAPPAPGTCTQ